MSVQDKTEKVLRSLHVLLSSSEPYMRDQDKVVVDKKKMLELLNDLNKCIYEIMDEYELTKQSRNRAERAFKKQGDEIIWDASRKAEDIYAASIMYTEEALGITQDIMSKATESVKTIYSEMYTKLKKQEQVVRKNQSELKSQLQDLVDTEKYLKLIDDRNREIAKEKAKKERTVDVKREPSIYANRQTAVKVNEQYLEKLGIPIEKKESGSMTKDAAVKNDVEVKVNLDADYFQWKKRQK